MSGARHTSNKRTEPGLVSLYVFEKFTSALGLQSERTERCFVCILEIADDVCLDDKRLSLMLTGMDYYWLRGDERASILGGE